MGFLDNGAWRPDGDYARDAAGRFLRPETQFRSWITPDGAPGPTGSGGYRAEAGRYHLYVSLACPWAHRTLIFRKLKGLERAISLSVTHWLLGQDGWTFEPGEGVVPDPVFGAHALHEVYAAARPGYTGRVSVPVLFDKRTRTIVNNESAEIIRMFNSAFDGVGAAPGDFYPARLRAEIDALNAEIYANVNNGVYRAGFASTQGAYEEAGRALFQTLDAMETRFADRLFLFGDEPTEADWRFFTTLVRFDPVYVGLFKCNIRRIADYPSLTRCLKALYHWPGVAETVDFDHIKRHYYGSLRKLNPLGIIPLGPALAL